jgi:hypothetical protein
MIDTLLMKSFAVLHSKNFACLDSWSLFEITTNFFLDTVVIKYPLLGSYNHNAEEALILLWTDYVMKFAGKIYTWVTLNYHCTDNSSQELLPDILRSITGSSTIPATGFHAIPTILFTDENRLTTASTVNWVNV